MFLMPKSMKLTKITIPCSDFGTKINEVTNITIPGSDLDVATMEITRTCISKENIKIAVIFLMALILKNILNNVIKPKNTKNES